MHFFTETGAGLPMQSATDAFGPDSNTATEESIYHVSARFQLAASTSQLKAFACEKSMMIVTDNDSDANLVNLILKPIPAPGNVNRFPQVAYYIYRGLDKASYLDLTVTTPYPLTPQASTNCETIAKMWAGSPPSPTPSKIGYFPLNPATDHVDKIFNKVIAGSDCREVLEGEWIGNFRAAGEIGLEIITDPEDINIDLAYVKKAFYKVETGTLADLPLKAKREEILAYIDPAAFFASFWDNGLSVSGGLPLKNTSLLTSVIGKFATQKRVYLDVRSEFGKSYNFYSNYKDTNSDNIKLGNSEIAPAVKKYLTKGWPIIYVETPVTTTEAKNDIRFHLRIDDNISPLLFNKKSDSVNTIEPQFLTDDKLFTAGAIDWTKEVAVQFPNSGTGAAKENVAAYFQFYYFRRKKSSASPATVFKANHYLDTVFGGVRLSGIETGSGKLKHVKNGRPRLNHKGTAYTYVSGSGVYVNADAAMLYVENIASFKKSGKVYPKADFGVFSTVPSFSLAGDSVLPKTIAYNKWGITVSSTHIDIIDVSLYNKTSTDTPKEDVFFLCFERALFDRLRYITGLSPHHDRFLVFTETNHTDDNGLPYTKYKVQIQGINPADGNSKIVTPAATSTSSTPGPDIFVYSSGENMLCSAGFTALANLPNQIPDPGLYKPWSNVGEWDYNESTAEVISLFPLVTSGVYVSQGATLLSDAVLFGDGTSASVLDIHPVATIKGIVRFPEEDSAAGSNTISTRQTSYPLIVIVPGNGHDYKKYDALCQHLAQNGFIAASISVQLRLRDFELFAQTPATTHELNGYDYNFRPSAQLGELYYYNSTTKKIATFTPAGKEYDDTGTALVTTTTTAAKAEMSWTEGTYFTVDLLGTTPLIRLKTDITYDSHGMGALGRANLLFNHLNVLNSKFSSSINAAAGIGILGHSRGGEGVVRAAADIAASPIPPASLKNIKAILSLAPSDQYKKESLVQNIAYNVLYGSRDGDISGVRQYSGTADAARGTGFALHDRAQNAAERSMLFVYGATHNGFITDNHDYKGTPVMKIKIQQAIANAYINAFFRKNLLNEPFWKPLFAGDEIPNSVQTAEKDKKPIYTQYREKAVNRQVIHNNGTPFSGVSVSVDVIAAPVSAPLYDVGAENLFSPHDTNGLHITWKGTGKLKFAIPAAIKNVTAYDYISFRITHVKGFYKKELDKLQVQLKDASNTFAANIPRKIPEPDKRMGDPKGEKFLTSEFLTKAAMITVRVPLSEFSGGGVDLTQISEVTFVFPGASTVTGKIQMEDIEFTK